MALTDSVIKLANVAALRNGDVFLFVCLSSVKFVKRFARWQHLVPSGGLLYRLRYTCFMHAVDHVDSHSLVEVTLDSCRGRRCSRVGHGSGPFTGRVGSGRVRSQNSLSLVGLVGSQNYPSFVGRVGSQNSPSIVDRVRSQNSPSLVGRVESGPV